MMSRGATLDELGVGEAAFAGWSAGGKALIQFTLAYPERVRSLALFELAAYWILEELGQTDSRLDESHEFLYGLAGKEVTEDDVARFLGFAGFVEDPAQVRNHPYWDRWVPHRMALSWLSEEVFRSGRSVKDLSSITCPVLLVKGTVTEPWEKRVVDVLGEYLPNARVVELEGDMPPTSTASTGFLRSSKPICTMRKGSVPRPTSLNTCRLSLQRRRRAMLNGASGTST